MFSFQIFWPSIVAVHTAHSLSLHSDLQTNFGGGRGCGATAEIVTASKTIRNATDAASCAYFSFDPKNCECLLVSWMLSRCGTVRAIPFLFSSVF